MWKCADAANGCFTASPGACCALRGQGPHTLHHAPCGYKKERRKHTAVAPCTMCGCSAAMTLAFLCAGKWLPLMCTMNCTGCPEEFQQAFSLSLAEATDLAAREPPGCEGVNVLPYFTGERTPDWPHARGSILGLTSGALQRPGLLYRAALEGSTYSLASGISLCASAAWFFAACLS